MAVNSKSKISLIVPLIILAVLFIYTAITRNKIVGAEETVKNQWGNLQGSYQRRADLVPQLVSAVKGASEYEKGALIAINEARAKVGGLNVVTNPNAENFEQQEKAQGELTNAANKAIAIIEKYPDLKGTQSFLLLQEQLVGTERRVLYSRKDFNAAVKDYNIITRNFPSSLVAKLFGYGIKEGFKAEEESQAAPEIKFSK